VLAIGRSVAVAELKVDASGHTLSWNDYKALEVKTQEALYVGGGSEDFNDWLIPFVLNVVVTKFQSGQNPQILTDLIAGDFDVHLLGRRPKPCQVLEIGPHRRLGLKLVVALSPPHEKSDILGPWVLSITVTPGQGQLSASTFVQVIDVSG
jgi:hypothetical protein